MQGLGDFESRLWTQVKEDLCKDLLRAEEDARKELARIEQMQRGYFQLMERENSDSPPHCSHCCPVKAEPPPVVSRRVRGFVGG